jgi:hypothetical protein
MNGRFTFTSSGPFEKIQWPPLIWFDHAKTSPFFVEHGQKLPPQLLPVSFSFPKWTTGQG